MNSSWGHSLPSPTRYNLGNPWVAEPPGGAGWPREGRGLGPSDTDLARGLDPLPDAEVADDPGKQEAQGQLPAQGPQVLDAVRELQYPPPGERRVSDCTCAAGLSSSGPPALVPRLVGSFTPIHEALLCPEMGVDREEAKTNCSQVGLLWQAEDQFNPEKGVRTRIFSTGGIGCFDMRNHVFGECQYFGEGQ